MDFNKIVGLVAIILAVIASFVTVPYAAPILGILGAVVGWSIIREDHVRVIVSALALRYLAETFNDIPTAGTFITAILGNAATVVAGAALIIILRNIYLRIKP